MSQVEPPPEGSVVEVTAGRGIVRFSGTTDFAPGKWVGIELDGPTGKNDGSINGFSYFSCRMLHGVFVRPSQVKVISLPQRQRVATPPSANVMKSPPTAMRSTLGHQRTGSNGLARVPSLRSAPSSATSRSASPQKPPGSPIKQTSNGKATPPVTAATPKTRTALPGAPSPTKRFSSSIAARPTLQASLSRTSRTPDSPADSPVVPTSQRFLNPKPARVSSPSPLSPSLSQGSTSPPPVPHTAARVQSPLSLPERPASAIAREIRAEVEAELQELRAKIRVLEAKRTDDARNIESLESQLSSANSFVAIRPKLLEKISSMQQELASMKREKSDLEQLSSLNESRMLDVQEQLEMVMLDKEVAEERAENAELEVQQLQEKVSTMEIELETLKEGGSPTATSEVDPTIKQSSAYIQLERHNERLKEALIRLRDLSHETETDQRKRISELERELAGVEELHSQFDSTLIKLSNAENQIDDLKAQLDDALGAEDLLVQLTERNLMLTEKIEEMRITIEDLEALKELNDELEENHVETEKALQEEIEGKDSQIRDQARKIEQLDENCQDLDGTIGQFRDLVLQLQAELEALRAQTQHAQSESAAATSQSAAMMSLNLKLQSSASKNQARNIELELRKIEARESKELLQIIQPYLPQQYVESDSDATSCYLFFSRLAAKIDLVVQTVGQAHGLPDALNGSVSEVLVGICELRGRASTLSILCKRFAAVLKRCDVESFLNIGRIYPEVAPLEKRIDMHIDLLRRDEFREMECVADVNKMHAQFEHLAEMYFTGFEYDLCERELAYALSFDNDLDMFTASIALTKTTLEAIIEDDDIMIEEDDDPLAALLDPLQSLLDENKGVKGLSRKLMKRLEDLLQDSSAVKSHLLSQLKSLNNGIPELVNFGIQLAQTVMPHLNDIRNSKSVLKSAAILTFVRNISASTVGKSQKGESSWDAVSEAIARLMQETAAVVPVVLEAENTVKIAAIPPWVTRVDEIKAALAINVEAERKITQLNEEIQGLARGIKSKDQVIQESNVKIELMERRMDMVKRQADTISELETELNNTRKVQKNYEEALEQVQGDVDKLTQENNRLKTQAAGAEKQPVVVPQIMGLDGIAHDGNLETPHLLEQIEALRGAVRFLRRENSYLKGQDLLREIQSLPGLPDFSSRPPTPTLVPTRPDSDDSDSDSDRPRTPPTLRSLATETTLLYKDVIKFSSAPKVVDLSVMNSRQGGKKWMPRKLTPSHQLLERKLEAAELKRRVRGLVERASILS